MAVTRIYILLAKSRKTVPNGQVELQTYMPQPSSMQSIVIWHASASVLIVTKNAGVQCTKLSCCIAYFESVPKMASMKLTSSVTWMWGPCLLRTGSGATLSSTYRLPGVPFLACAAPPSPSNCRVCPVSIPAEGQ